MSYPTNPYSLGQAYVNPVTGVPVLNDICAYTPTVACAYTDTRSNVIAITDENMCIPDSCKFFANIAQIANAPANAPVPATPPTITAANVFATNALALAAGFKPGQLYYTSLTGATAIAY
jgi:hypothetical protein